MRRGRRPSTLRLHGHPDAATDDRAAHDATPRSRGRADPHRNSVLRASGGRLTIAANDHQLTHGRGESLTEPVRGLGHRARHRRTVYRWRTHGGGRLDLLDRVRVVHAGPGWHARYAWARTDPRISDRVRERTDRPHRELDKWGHLARARIERVDHVGRVHGRTQSRRHEGVRAAARRRGRHQFSTTRWGTVRWRTSWRSHSTAPMPIGPSR